MSEDWKNDRAEAEMRKHEAEMMKKLHPKQKKITKTWTVTATAVGESAESLMSEFESGLVALDSNANKTNGIEVAVMSETNEDEV